MVALDVAGAVFASITVALVKISEPEKIIVDSAQGKLSSLLTEIKEGYKIIKSNKGLFILLWFGVGLSILYSSVNALFPLMSIDYFRGTTTQASIIEVVFSLGMLLGGTLLGVWGGFKNRGISMSLSMGLIGIGVFASGLLPFNGFAFFAVFSFLIGFSSPFYSGPQTALMQERISPEYLGRVFGLYGSLMSFAMLLGLVFTGIFADITGFNVWFIISGGIIILLGLMMIFSPSVRNIEKEK